MNLKNYIFYLFFGVCTTAINVFTYWIAAHSLHLGTMPSTVLAWIIAVAFAYITNRKWIFCSNTSNLRDILFEIFSFAACRLATGCIDWVCMLVLVDFMGLNDVLIKITANIVVIVLNYLGSKLVIFRKHN